MKKSNFTLSILGLFALLLFNACSEKANAPNKETDIPSVTNQVTQKSKIDGSWYLIKGEYGGETRKEESPFQLKLFVDDYFSYIMRSADSTAWQTASAGSFELEGNIYRETHLYSNQNNIDADEILVEWRYELKNDTLIMEGPVKMLIDGVEDAELMGGYNTVKEIRVRAKKNNQL